MGETEMLADLPAEGVSIEANPEGVIWSRDDLEKIENLGSLLHHDLSERQLMLIADIQMERERLAQTDRTVGPSPETDPNNPNAPNH